MPAYHTHAVFADQFYLDNLKDEKIFKEECNLQSLKTYSLCTDLVFPTKPFVDNHNYKTKEFLLELIKNVKRSNLQDDKYVLSMLYGHISHYFLDIHVHPFVYYNEQGLDIKTIASPHSLYEGYLSYYFLMKLKNIHMEAIYHQYFSRGNIHDSNCVNILNTSFENVYGNKNVQKAFEKGLRIATTSDSLGRLPIFDVETARIVSGYKKLLRTYEITEDDFHNESHKEWFNPITNERHTESVEDLFNKALEDTYYAIEAVNEYLYNNKSLESLETIFTGLSYDTGVSCDIPKKFKYVRKFNKVK